MSQQDYNDGYNSAHLAIQVLEERVKELEAERDRLRELLDIFKDACDPGKLDHQKLKSTRGLKDGMYRCEKHGGHGFVSDCEICNVEKMLTERDKRIASLEAERDAAYNRGMERALTIVSESSNVFEAHESIRKEIKT